MWGMRTSAFAQPMRFLPAWASASAMGLVRTRVSISVVRSLCTRASAPVEQSLRTSGFASAARSSRTPARVPAVDHSGASAMRVRHIGAAGPGRRPRAGVCAEPVPSARGGPYPACSSRSSASIADASFPEPAPARSSAGSVAPAGTGRLGAALSESTPIARHSCPSNVLRATRGPKTDRPSRTPVNSILRGFVTHRACRLSARPCILNGIDASSPDGRNRSTTRGVKV